MIIACLLLSLQELQPAFRTFDLDPGESAEAAFADGRKATVRLLSVEETRDELCAGVRRAAVQVEVAGKALTLPTGTYHLPTPVAGFWVDCPVTKGYLDAARSNVWGLEKRARLRVWPRDEWIDPATFIYPAKQRWFATWTQMANEPVWVDGGDVPGERKIYYHYGLDIGGSEGRVDVVAATDGRVVSSGTDVHPDHRKDTPVASRYDVVYLLDGRGWYYRYSHLKVIEPEIKVGARVKIGQKVGVLGKEGGSGGWSHLHFDITSRQPSGKWGIQEGYAFLWQAYLREHKPALVANARPHDLIWAGQKARLDGSRSWGRGLRHEWIFSDGGKAEGGLQERVYETPGTYSEILKVTDAEGRVDYDFAVVQVWDKANPAKKPPSIHANYAPTFGIKPGDPVTFKVRSFRTEEGGETWDFGDGTPPVTVKSDGNAKQLAPDGYAEIVRGFAKPGQYLVKVEHVARNGLKATARLHVRVEAP